MENQAPQPQQIPDVDVSFKLAFIQSLLVALDDVPHKYVRNVIDAITQETNKQLQAMQQSAPKAE